MAPRVGLEPTACRLTAECSTIELTRHNIKLIKRLVLLLPSITASTLGRLKLQFLLYRQLDPRVKAIVQKLPLQKAKQYLYNNRHLSPIDMTVSAVCLFAYPTVLSDNTLSGYYLVPQVGLEPTTCRFSVYRSYQTELPRHVPA